MVVDVVVIVVVVFVVILATIGVSPCHTGSRPLYLCTAPLSSPTPHHHRAPLPPSPLPDEFSVIILLLWFAF